MVRDICYKLYSLWSIWIFSWRIHESKVCFLLIQHQLSVGKITWLRLALVVFANSLQLMAFLLKHQSWLLSAVSVVYAKVLLLNMLLVFALQLARMVPLIQLLHDIESLWLRHVKLLLRLRHHQWVIVNLFLWVYLRRCLNQCCLFVRELLKNLLCDAFFKSLVACLSRWWWH